MCQELSFDLPFARTLFKELNSIERSLIEAQQTVPTGTNVNKQLKDNSAEYAFTRLEFPCKQQLRHMSIDQGQVVRQGHTKILILYLNPLLGMAVRAEGLDLREALEVSIVQILLIIKFSNSPKTASIL